MLRQFGGSLKAVFCSKRDAVFFNFDSKYVVKNMGLGPDRTLTPSRTTLQKPKIIELCSGRDPAAGGLKIGLKLNWKFLNNGLGKLSGKLYFYYVFLSIMSEKYKQAISIFCSAEQPNAFCNNLRIAYAIFIIYKISCLGCQLVIPICKFFRKRTLKSPKKRRVHMITIKIVIRASLAGVMHGEKS